MALNSLRKFNSDQKQTICISILKGRPLSVFLFCITNINSLDSGFKSFHLLLNYLYVCITPTPFRCNRYALAKKELLFYICKMRVQYLSVSSFLNLIKQLFKIIKILKTILYQYSITMVNFVLNYLCSPTGKSFDASLKLNGLPLYFNRFITFARSWTAEKRQTRFFSIIWF